jgi:hypothetical protein
MSNSAPDDPIKNKPANPRGEAIHSATPRSLNSASAAQAASDEHFGSFDYASQFDPSGQEHITFGRYDVGNNNIVVGVYQTRHRDGSLSERTFRIGNIESISDPNYVKIDSVRGAHKHGQWVMNLAGHKIVDSPDNHVRKMGQIKDQQATPDVVWLVFLPFEGKWDDMSGTLKTLAEHLASIGSMSGYSETHFGASDHEIRSHIAKIVAVAVEHVG